MKTKTLKILVTIATILMIVAMGASTVFALAPNAIKPNESVNGSSEIQSAGQNILGILNVVGVVLAVLIITILGIKYMMGSAEEKAEYKKTMIPYLVGALFIFAAPTIANIVYQFMQSLK